MLRPARFFSCLMLLSALAGLALLSSSPMHAQAPQDKPPKLIEAKRRLKQDESRRINDLLKGNQPYTPEDSALIKLGAENLIYPLTYSGNYKPDSAGYRPGVYAKMILAAEIIIDTPMTAKNEAAMKLAREEIYVCLKRVVQDRDQPRIVSMNSTRLMAHFAAQGREETADLFTAILNDKDRDDATKFYALTGLKELFHRLKNPLPPEKPIGFKDAQREASAIEAILTALNRPGPSMAATPEEMEGFRLFRREALRALAQTRVPALADGKSRPAQRLLEFARDTGIRPEPRFDEQVEGAVGAALMPPDGAANYQPEVAAYHIGMAVATLSLQQQRELQVRGKESKTPWKIHGARLAVALRQMRDEAARLAQEKKQQGPAVAAAKYIAAVYDRCQPVLQSMENGSPADPRQLSAWLTNNSRADDPLFKGVDGSVLKPVEKTEPEPKPEEEKKDDKKDDNKKDGKKDGKKDDKKGKKK